MRTLGLSLAAIAFGAALVSPSVAIAQRNSRRTSHNAIPTTARSATTLESATAAGDPCTDNCGDYSLAVVSAVLPSENPSERPGSAGVELVTLVIENRGTAPAPAALVSVAPKNQLAAARYSSIPVLAPGQRATVQLPLELGPDGTECISITIRPAPERDPSTRHALASANLDPGMTVPPPANVARMSGSPGLPYWPDPPAIFVTPPTGLLATAEDASGFDAIRKPVMLGTLDV